MQRPLLLIVDGESLKNPGLEHAMDADGWDLAWISSRQAPGVAATDPSLVLLDPIRDWESGVRAVNVLRAKNPALSVVLLEPGSNGRVEAVLPAIAGRLQRGLPADRWPSFLRGFLPPQPEHKLTTEDLFGDILADIDGRPTPEPAAPEPARVPEPASQRPTPAPAAPSAPRVPSPVKPVVVQVPLSRPTVNRAPVAPKPAVPVPTQSPVIKTPLVRPSVTTPSLSPRPAMRPSTPVPHAVAPQPATAPVSAPKPQPAPVPVPITPQVPAPVVETRTEPSVESPESSVPVVETLSASAEIANEKIVLPIQPPPPESLAKEMPPPSAPTPSILPDLFGELLGPLAEAPAAEPANPAESLDDGDFTLSDISGIHDPFGSGPKEVPLEPRLLPDALEKNDEIEFLDAGDATPAKRSPSQVAGSLVVQPPAVPLSLDSDLSLESQENPLEEFGNYYLLEKIAVGGMAELFKARQRGVHNFEKIVAIKRILPHLSDNDEFVRMFIDEAKLAAQLTHPNIVQIFDLGKASGFYYIAMEYVDGKDLRSLLRKVREYRLPMPEPVAAYVTMKVAMALDYAHRKRGMNDKELKLVHRDVSPQNVLISSEGAVKLVDFGIAKAATKSTQTMAGALKGKLLYMSPEQALGQALDNRSDIYSLGLVLFELLTGERCFQADSELGVLEKVRLGKVQDIQAVNPAISRDMAQVLAEALQKNVDQRYHSARLMERDLKSLLVKHSNEPTDHDVAEYVNTLLKGTKEQLQVLLSTHFAQSVPVAPPPVAPPAPVVLVPKAEDQPTIMKKPVPLPEPPPQELGFEADRSRSRWILPAVFTLIVLGTVAFWLLRH